MPIVRYDFMCFWVAGDRMVTEDMNERVLRRFQFECLPLTVTLYGETGDYSF